MNRRAIDLLKVAVRKRREDDEFLQVVTDFYAREIDSNIRWLPCAGDRALSAFGYENSRTGTCVQRPGVRQAVPYSSWPVLGNM